MRNIFLQHIMLSVLLLAVLGKAIETSAFATVPVGHATNLPIESMASFHVLNASPEMNDPHDDGSELTFKKKGQLVPGIALVTLISCAVAAKVGLLPGPPLADGGFGPYTNSMIGRDVGSAILTGSLGYIFVKTNTWLAENEYLDPRDSRKIIHTLSAPLFIALWPIFSAAEGARFFAASVSFVNAIRLFLAGTGEDKSLAFAVSR